MVRMLNKSLSSLAVAAALIVGASAGITVIAPVKAQAQSTSGSQVVIAVIDRERIMTQSTAGKSLRSAVDARRKQVQDDIQKRQDALIKARQQIEQQRASITPQDYQNKLADLNKQGEALRLDVQNKGRSLDESVQKALGTLQDTAFTIVKQIAAQKNISLVLYRDTVAWAPGAVDITSDVVAQMNTKLPSVKF